MKIDEINIEVARQCLKESLQLIKARKNEQVIRDSFTSHLRQIFPASPGWVVRHIRGSEAAVKISKGERITTGFVDNLVDLTAVEYEADLTITSKYHTGLNQVKDYCAGLINADHDPDLIIGVLSDTVRWYAYEVEASPMPRGTRNRDNIALRQVAFIDCSAAQERSAITLIDFLEKYLGRIGARPVSAWSIAKDLGFDSPFCKNHIDPISSIITTAFNGNPKYAGLVSTLWCAFVSYLREDSQSGLFNLKTYTDEYYILILGKLICANYLEQKAISSDDAELASIIDGRFFENRGLLNFVEYDYFGWLNTPPHIGSVLPIAREIQKDLMAYDFSRKSEEDLFGKLMVQLADRSQRLLLGQEWTPSWLSRALVTHVADQLPSGESLRFLDMCCGSGSMIVETLKIAQERISQSTQRRTKAKKLQLLTQSIAGFDIDPLAVMLSKINWVLTAMDWLQPLGNNQISIPVYHADSLFAITPISNITTDKDKTVYTLKIAEYRIELPGYLIAPKYRAFFDKLIDLGYRVVQEAQNKPSLDLDRSDLAMLMETIRTDASVGFEQGQFEEVLLFFEAWVVRIDALNRDKRNGIWSYILRNSFRPGLELGQFNGLVSNPPWLALSKVANNPYKEVLKKKAEAFDIKPGGASHLHIELATIFLLHAIRQYMADGARIGCIVPETVLNGHHQNAFRRSQFLTAPDPVPFKIKEIWRVQEHVFKNNAVILFGTKTTPGASLKKPIPGQIIFEHETQEPITFYRNIRGNRTAWTEKNLGGGKAGFYEPASFRQGADIMPRNMLFYETMPASNTLFFSVQSIDPITSPLAFVVKDAKKHLDFHVKLRILPKELFFEVITSNLLTPFDVAGSLKALLPIKKNAANQWEMLSKVDLLAKGFLARNTFNSICATIDPGNASINALFLLIDTRNKLTQQVIEPSGFLVLTGAGGGNVCAAYIDLGEYEAGRLIIDQTVYWAQVDTEDEAIYLTGLLASEAISLVINEFQPRGAQGKRHVHKLPFEVTPPFDPSQAAHQDVVEKTRALINDYRQLKKASPLVKEQLDPNTGALSMRRRKLLSFIKSRASYAEYDEACRSLYGI